MTTDDKISLEKGDALSTDLVQYLVGWAADHTGTYVDILYASGNVMRWAAHCSNISPADFREMIDHLVSAYENEHPAGDRVHYTLHRRMHRNRGRERDSIYAVQVDGKETGINRKVTVSKPGNRIILDIFADGDVLFDNLKGVQLTEDGKVATPMTLQDWLKARLAQKRKTHDY